MRAPWLLDHAPYAPFMDPRTARAPGLAPLDMTEWTVRHADFAAQMTRRREVLAEHSDVVLGALAESEPAENELLGMVLTHLGDGPRRLTLEERFCPLTALGNLVAEDFCILLPDAASGEYVLAAAVLCFPSRWLLSEKLGRPLTVVHDPVPDYDATLARRVNRVFEVLAPARPLVRVNWGLHPTPELFLPLGRLEKRENGAHEGRDPYLRTERQTLVKLPETGAVAFGIKTSVTPIGCLTPAEAGSLRGAVAAMDGAGIAYSSTGRIRDTALRRLATIAAGTAVQPPDR